MATAAVINPALWTLLCSALFLIGRASPIGEEIEQGFLLALLDNEFSNDMMLG
eukprot:CAMPEP_0201937954 /NCGR_PEP_ID=MMETSP0903-20130614/40483_1 /ASSEMBLY_ACC=CAM_ASM_000552 /TAXON_ID=420261 /ORGANISM="Thalassiosira antarctica, Strain CCMP982" /LENGTH=52 /DNA_ID=CAMNT_0048479091 /DNA_START=128 /DNA_END=286 /DNA_ORIENTATION=-